MLYAQQLDKVVDLVNANGEWDINFLTNLFDQDTIAEIIAVHLPRIAHGDDVCLWRGSKDGAISVASLYKTIRADNVEHEVDTYWNKLSS